MKEFKFNNGDELTLHSWEWLDAMGLYETQWMLEGGWWMKTNYFNDWIHSRK